MTETEELQALFDISLNHIRAQGHGSVEWVPKPAETGRTMLKCSYGTEGGPGCAAAPFISNRSTLTGSQRIKSFSSLVKSGVSVDPVAGKHAPFVDDLQSAHDRSATDVGNTGRRMEVPAKEFLRLYEARMRNLAADYSLTYTPPQETE